MSDPIARYYEVVIIAELKRQKIKGDSTIYKLVNIGELASALAKEQERSELHPLSGLLEPGARRYDVQTSIAISMKRIADALAPAEGITFGEVLSQKISEGISFGAENAITTWKHSR